jgi:hypothetical protein
MGVLTSEAWARNRDASGRGQSNFGPPYLHPPLALAFDGSPSIIPISRDSDTWYYADSDFSAQSALLTPREKKDLITTDRNRTRKSRRTVST